MTIRIAAGIATGLALLGGCADLMGRSVVAPEWFEAKAEEVKGQGYPDLYSVPQAQPFTPRSDWEDVARQLEAEAAPLREAARNDEGVPTSEEIRARAAQLRAGVADDSETDSDTQ